MQRFYRTEVVFGTIGGACFGLIVGRSLLGNVDVNAAATLVGAGLGAALSVWGAFVVAARQSALGDRHFQLFAIDVVNAIRDEANLSSLVFVHVEAADDAKLSDESMNIIKMQISGLLTALSVFDTHVSMSQSGSYKLRLETLKLSRASNDAGAILRGDIDKWLRGTPFQRDKVWGRIAQLQVSCQEFLMEVGVKYDLNVEDETVKERIEELKASLSW